MDTEEVSDRFVAPCFVSGLEAYDGEINLEVEENMISNEKNKGEEKSNDDWDHLVDFNIDEVPLLGEEGLPPFMCRMGKISRNKKRAMENLNFFYQDVGTSSSAEGHLTQEKATKEAIATRMSRKFALLEEEGPIIETMAYNDKYKKILDKVWKDKVELDGKIVKEEEDATKRIMGEALKEKDGSGAFMFPIILEGITMIKHTQAEAMGILPNVLCRVGVTILLAKFLILDISIDRDSSIVVGRRFLQSDSDDKQDYQIKRNKFGAPIYEPKPAPYLNCNYPDERSLALQIEHTIIKPDHHDPNTQDNMKPWKRINRVREIDDMLRIRLREAGSNEEIFTSMAWIRAFNINELIYAELCLEFYSTYEFDKVCADDELQTKKIIKFRLGGRAHSLTLLEFARRNGKVLTEDVVRNLSALIYCRDLDTITLRDLIDSDGKLIPEDPQSRVPRVGIPRPPRASMQDLYDRMGKMEIRQEAIERMEKGQSYHWDRYEGVFEHMARVYSVQLQRAYTSLGYAQPQYDQYYQQYPLSPPQYQQQQHDDE
nr:hypothetical protein [Tanacetum cinerariifolium]